MLSAFQPHTSFSEKQAQKNLFLNQVDTRPKLALTLLIISLVTAADHPFFPLSSCLFSVLILQRLGIHFNRYKKKLIAPFSIAFFLVIMQPFLVQGTPLFTLPFLRDAGIIISREGCWQGILLATKIFSAVLAMIVFMYTTTMDSLIKVAAWAKIPPVLIDLSLLMYRFIFLFSQVATKIGEAQKLRFGYIGYKNSLHSGAILLGMVFLHAFDQAVMTRQAMKLRLFQGTLTPEPLAPLSTKELAGSLVIASLLITFFWKTKTW